MSFRRMLPFLLVNVVVSATVILAILFWWDGRQAEQTDNSTATSIAATAPAVAATVEAVAQATDTPEPETGPLLHTVKAGETLGSLSEFYDVPLEDVMSANDISNPNLISVGQELIIPIGGIPTATPLPTNTPAPEQNERPTPIPTEPPIEGEAIVEIANVTGIGVLVEEAVQVSNIGSRQIALMGWTLRDSSGHVYTFGQVTLFGDGAAIQIHTETGQDGPADLYWGLETPIWESGEQVTLLNADGDIVTVFDIP